MYVVQSSGIDPRTLSLLEEINKSFSKVFKRKGILSFIKSLFSKEEQEKIAEEVVLDLKEKELLNEIKERWEEIEKLISQGVKIDWEEIRNNNELRKLYIEQKLLDEIPNIKIEDKKFLGLFSRKYVSMNPGYEEFFYDTLGNFSVNEIYEALKDLERESKGYLKEKIRALKNEYERREGIKRRNLIAKGLLSLIIISGLAYAVYYSNRSNYRRNDTTTTTSQGNDTTTSPISQTSTTTAVIDSDNDGIPDSLERGLGLDPSKPNPNAAYLIKHNLTNYLHIVKPLDSDGIMQENEKIFVDFLINNKKILPIKTFQNYLFNITSDGNVTNDELKRAENFAFVVSKAFDLISQSDIAKDKILDTDYSAQLALLLGFDTEKAREATAKAIAYYAIAVKNLNLPEEIDALRILTRGSQVEKYGDHLMDFDPIMIKDVTNKTIVIQSKNIPRDVWMLARFLSYRPEIISEPKKFEWINRMIQQVAWDIFDSPYGPNSEWIEPTSAKRHYPENLTPTSEKVWQVILGFHDYMDSLPSKLEKDGIGIIFPFHDSDELQKYIADKTNRTIALFYLAALPSMTLDKMNFKAKWDEAWNIYYQGLIDKNTLEKLLNDALKESIVIGIDAMKKFVEQLPSEYEEIVKLYPDGKVGRWNEDPRNFYYGWLGDRQGHGLDNTVYQFVGIKRGEVDTLLEYIELAKNRNAIDQFLTKSWKHWDLVKFIYGYESYKAQDWGGEWEMYGFGLPIAFRAFGIPHNQGIGASATSGNFGGYNSYGHVEFTIYGVPQDVIDKLLDRKDLGRIAIGYGNGISLMSCIDGVEKDSGYEIFQWSPRWSKIYLWKK